MPTLCRPWQEGGMGFDYRLQVGAAAWVIFIHLGDGPAEGGSCTHGVRAACCIRCVLSLPLAQALHPCMLRLRHASNVDRHAQMYTGSIDCSLSHGLPQMHSPLEATAPCLQPSVPCTDSHHRWVDRDRDAVVPSSLPLLPEHHAATPRALCPRRCFSWASGSETTIPFVYDRTTSQPP